MQVAKDTVVSIDYSLKNSAGEVLDTSEGAQPLSYLHGHKNIVPGLEEALEGHEEGADVSVTVPPEKGYGPRHDELVQTAPLSAFPEDNPPTPGMRFQAETQNGPTVIQVTKVEGDEVTVDANHVLAGEDLNFDVTVKQVRAATEQELEHGHVHEAGEDH
jgi:FKBP-type peptidyl-prolyl cis-trans isomerase SlyD